MPPSGREGDRDSGGRSSRNIRIQCRNDLQIILGASLCSFTNQIPFVYSLELPCVRGADAVGG